VPHHAIHTQVLKRVADKHGVSVANVALRWVMQQGAEGSVIPIVGVRGTEHIADNERVLALTLDTDDLGSIQEVLARAQGPAGDIYSYERGDIE
jgi:diketogulonate reductase-like aldo/keto reductase